jgi:hypothetical protein
MTPIETFEFIACLAAMQRLGRDLWEYVKKERHTRIVEPKLRMKQVFLDEAQWYEERAALLAGFHFQLTTAFDVKKPPDKWKLAEMVSKLDRQDQEFAMKCTDYDALAKWALWKGQECHDNADQASRMATEVDYKILSEF